MGRWVICKDHKSLEKVSEGGYISRIVMGGLALWLQPLAAYGLTADQQ